VFTATFVPEPRKAMGDSATMVERRGLLEMVARIRKVVGG